MNNTNNSIEARIENVKIRLANMRAELKAIVTAEARCRLAVLIEKTETRLAELLDNRDNHVLANKIAGLINSLSVGQSITVSPLKLVNERTLANWKNTEVVRSVRYGNTVTPTVTKIESEVLNAKKFLHDVRACFTVERTTAGTMIVTRKAYRKPTEAGYSTPEDMVLDFFGVI